MCGRTAGRGRRRAEGGRMRDRFDILIIGAGATGCAIARELSFYDLSVAVLEKNSYVCAGQSKANGAIIHGGHDPRPGSLKARLNVEGNPLCRELSEELGVDMHRTGIYVCAFDGSEMRTLRELMARGERNGVPGLRLVPPREIRKTEPRISDGTVGALSVPTGGVIDVLRYVIALAEYSAVNGVRYLFETEVAGLTVEDGRLRGVRTTRGEFHAPIVINAAGVHADDVMRMEGYTDVRITPRKGEYYVIDSSRELVVSRPCFPVPTPHGKGILIYPSTTGNTLMGGDSVEVEDPEDTSTTEEGFEKVCAQVTRLVPDLESDGVIAQFAGVRASANTGDFVIRVSDRTEGLVHVAGISSPGLTASPAIARYVVEMMQPMLHALHARRKKNTPYRLKPLFRDADGAQQSRMLRADPSYGHVVCRCEGITEGDIVDAIHAPIPARTIDALKFRTKAGLGRCQGAFDICRIIKIICRETSLDPEDIVKNVYGSNTVTGGTPGL
jgi:glycerol-3-phosphate dehydrogenase